MSPINRYRGNKKVSLSVWSLESVCVRNPAGHRRPIHGERPLPARLASLTRDVGRLKPWDAEIQGHCDGWAACYPFQATVPRDEAYGSQSRESCRRATMRVLCPSVGTCSQHKPPRGRNAKGSNAFTVLHPQTCHPGSSLTAQQDIWEQGTLGVVHLLDQGAGWSRKSRLEGAGGKPSVTWRVIHPLKVVLLGSEVNGIPRCHMFYWCTLWSEKSKIVLGK